LKELAVRIHEDEKALEGLVQETPALNCVRSLPGMGPILAAVVVSEIDAIGRFCILRTRQRHFRLRLFLQHFRGALPGHCGRLAEMLGSVTAKKVRSRRILFKVRLLRTVFGDRLRRNQGDGPQVTIGYEPQFAKTARISRESPTEGWRRGRWGSFGNALQAQGSWWEDGDKNMDFATLPVMPNRQDMGEKNDIGRITLFAAEPTFQ
jgi:hypothetical protein